MALVWEKTRDGVTWQVRSAGRSVRLYENGILHTQVHPLRLFTGSVWDLLSLPSLMMPAGPPKRVLLLGVGGGVVIRQLRALWGEVDITGVELSGLHLMLATRFFGLDPASATLVQAEAGAFVDGYDGPRFDLVIDDIFAERDGYPARAIAADADWIRRLRRLMSPRSALVTNFVSAREFRTSALAPVRLEPRIFPSAFSFSTPHCENVIAACFTDQVRDGALEESLAAHRVTSPRGVRSQLRYRARRYR